MTAQTINTTVLGTIAENFLLLAKSKLRLRTMPSNTEFIFDVTANEQKSQQVVSQYLQQLFSNSSGAQKPEDQDLIATADSYARRHEKHGLTRQFQECIPAEAKNEAIIDAYIAAGAPNMAELIRSVA